MENKTKKFIFITLGVGAFLLFKNKLFGSSAKLTEVPNYIIIGDSHAIQIGAHLNSVKINWDLAHSGWNVNNLINALNSTPVDEKVKKVFISIGTNSGFNLNDNITGLVNKLKTVYPNAILYAIQGSYGWGNFPNAQANYSKYYLKFKNLGVLVLLHGLGYFDNQLDAHYYKNPSYQQIINDINN
jgi:hypothetical protein